MKILSDLPRNARYPVLLDPLWALFGGVISYYLPLYMKGIGLSEVKMGIVNTLGVFCGLFFFIFAGAITNRLGRKKTTFIFDTVAWTIPMLLWAVAKNFWFFLAAAIINASVKVVLVSFNCLITEDTPADKRARVFGIFYIINYACGLFTPVVGMIASGYGIVPVMRMVYFLGAISMTSLFIIRNSLVTETAAGRELMDKHSGKSLVQSLLDYISSVRKMVENKKLRWMTAVYILTNFTVALNFFQVLFLKERLGFGNLAIAVLPGISALINISMFIFAFPRLGKKFKETHILRTAAVISAAGSFIFLLIPKGSLLILVLDISVLAVGNFMLQSYRDSVLMNVTGEEGKADMFAAVQTLTTLFCIPAGYIGGYCYSIHPLIPFIIIFVLSLAVIPFTDILGKSPLIADRQKAFNSSI